MSSQPATIPQEMLCAVYYGHQDVRLETRPVPPVEPGMALLKVAFCGICGSEIHALFKPGRPTSNMYVPGRILGHEYSGAVVAVGAGVKTVSPGDRVAGGPGLACGRCANCRRGERELCQDVYRPPGGAWAEYTLVPEEMLYHLPENISWEFGAMTEPVASCINTIERAGVQLGDTALIIGAGVMGSVLLQLLQRRGASFIIVSEPNPLKRTLAAELGADIVIDPTTEDVVSRTREAIGGQGVDHAIEAAGIAQGVQQCLEAVRHGGVVTLHGVVSSEQEIPIRPYDFFARVLRVQGTIGLQWVKAIRMLPKLNLSPLLAEPFPLKDIHAAIQHHRDGKGIKVLLQP